VTPIRRQYLKIKHSFPDAIVLFRMGDFYETFDEDARVAARDLEITLTSRSMGKDVRVPMAGVPAHAMENYLARLVKKGHKVAICEQLTDPAASKGLVDRGVVRVVTPGTVLESSLLDQNTNNYLASVVIEGDSAGLAYVDVTTGEFAAAQLDRSQLPPELPSCFEYEGAKSAVLDHFGVVSLESFGCQDLPLAVRAAGAIVDYLGETQKSGNLRLANLAVYYASDYMILDSQTRRNLELFAAGRAENKELSLLATLDLSKTPMGGRLMRRWLGQPLLELEELNRRLDSVGYFFEDGFRRANTSSLLSQVPDMERILGRINAGMVVPRELLALKHGLDAVPGLVEQLGLGLETEDSQTGGGEDVSMAWLSRELSPIPEVGSLIESAIAPEPSGAVGEGNVIREGFSPELDELKKASRDARGYIAGLELKERERTGLRGLKVGYNQVFGYYIEVSKANVAQVPEEYIRRQTLVNSERYIVPELKEYESLVLNARERLDELEKTLYRQVCRQISESGAAISRLAAAIAQLDVFAGLGEIAVRNGYVRPSLDMGDVIDIKDGRHPVVEGVLPPGGYVPNDVYLSNGDAKIIVLTGPNMAGKSTFIRQAAIIILMAQIGSFVPATQAVIGLVDRIFTRVGLQDDLTTGQSTFMVEMVETAAILNQATPRSLVVLDEIGRGTSTYDGMAIAQSVIEHLHNDPRLGCKTLFATHYHELTQLANTLPGVRNFTVAVAEEDGDVIFLHRIAPGTGLGKCWLSLRKATTGTDIPSAERPTAGSRTCRCICSIRHRPWPTRSRRWTFPT